MLKLDSIFVPKDSSEIQQRILEDIELAARVEGVVDVPISPGTDLHYRTRANSRVNLQCFAASAVRYDERSVLHASFEALEEMRVELGMPEGIQTRAAGKVHISVEGGGSVTIVDGTALVWPNGIKGLVNGTQVAKVHNDTIPVVATDTGEEGNLAAGQKLRFVNPPLNVGTEATVSVEDPIKDGVSKEDAPRLRARIINRLRNNPQGANPAEIIEWALQASSAVSYAFVYPALGGPSSFKLVVVRAPDVENGDFSRALSVTTLSTIDAYVRSKILDHVEFVVQSPAEVGADVAIKVDMPPSPSNGGDGNGWKDDVPWPTIGSGGKVQVNQYVSPTNVHVNATDEPEVGHRFLWWAPSERAFIEATVTSASGIPGNWNITVDVALTDSTATNVAVGDFISPSCAHFDAYAAAFRSMLSTHGPGEQTEDADLLPRSLRFPRPNEEVILPAHETTLKPAPTGIGARQLNHLISDRDEITDADFSYRNVEEPAAPALVSGKPEILIPRKFGIYPML